MPSLIDTKRIRTDLDTQSRIALVEDVVKEYMEAMETGNVFPAILVFYDAPNDQFILADGFHRFAAHQRLKPNDQILAEQRLGTVRMRVGKVSVRINRMVSGERMKINVTPSNKPFYIRKELN
ncbi:hypothetical protein FACS18942_07150 [Planctomycetales bacterium]|nr:hypothetical protein FACS18942_07150 [Planctomycetales bacterium]